MIYVDANATYPVEPSHYDKVAAKLKDVDGNPSSIHESGRNAKVALEAARTNLAKLLGARSAELVFTSGATEANNLAIQGVIGARPKDVIPPHLIVTAAEHSSVLEPAKVLEARGLCRVSLAPVKKTGEVDVEALLALVGPETALVCVMHANNETGAINPVADIAKRVKQWNPQAKVHVDGVQMLGKADLTWYGASAIDSAAFSGHKLGAFKGIGALYVRPGTKMQLLAAGGGQERGRRPGTENMPGIVSFGLRCDEVKGTEARTAAAMLEARDLLKRALREIPGVVLHDGAPESLPNTVNFHVEGVPGDDILLNFDLAGIQASSGSACSSGVARPSHVLTAMGYPEWVALNSVRVSFHAGAKESDVAEMIKVLSQVCKRSRT